MEGGFRVVRRSVAGKAVRVMIWVLAGILGVLAVLAAALLLISPGRVQPYLDGDGKPLQGSVSEKIWVDIGGVRQGMFIRGRSDKNPVLLFVHGGPGMPEYFLAEKSDAALEDQFTVCYWEQRGAGLSYENGMSGASITADRLIEDTIEVSRYLFERFGRQKIYLMAHSWGSFLGIQAAAKAPELYRAYIGVAQVTDTAESERLAYARMLELFEANGNRGMVQKLKAWDVPNTRPDTALIPYFKSMLRDEAMHMLGVGTMRDMDSVVTGVFIPSLRSRAYTLPEKITLWRAKAFLRSETNLLQALFTTRIRDTVPELTIPAYILFGKYDLTVNPNLAKEYLNALKAPLKGFYTFTNSAHSPMFEEPERFIEIMKRDVLEGKTSLADR
jgi:pimeloyl-ACP methyl ester carboxylesterase